VELDKSVRPQVNPQWKPLEDLAEPIRSRALNELMYMAGYTLCNGTVVHTYKHVETRQYLNLSIDGRAWKHTAGGYVEVDLEECMKNFFR